MAWGRGSFNLWERRKPSRTTMSPESLLFAFNQPSRFTTIMSVGTEPEEKAQNKIDKLYYLYLIYNVLSASFPPE